MIDVLVTGRSLPALQAALDLAEVGLAVAIAAPSGREGLDGEGERDPEGTIAAFMRRIAQPLEGGALRADAEPRLCQPEPPLLRDQSGRWRPQATPEVLGIPAVPLAEETIALIGARGALRGYLDRIKPLLTVGKTRELGRLVRNRMGAAVLERLVAPQVFERYGVGADEVDVAVAAPGLNEALSRSGALSAGVLAYADRNVARETRVSPAGGESALLDAALKKLAFYGVTLLNSAVTELEESLEGWTAVLENGDRLEARAVVADQGRSPQGFEPLEPLLGSVLPSAARLRVEMEIGRPDWLGPGCAALSSAEGWAVRLESSGESEGAVVRLTSEVFDVSQHDIRAADACENGVRVFAEIFEDASRADAECTARSAQLYAAPYATLADRDAARAALEALVFGNDTLLPVGRALHGDDLGAALESAHAETVVLRRRLLGLEVE